MRTPFAIIGMALLPAAAGDVRPSPGATPPAAIEASVTACGSGWTHPRAGAQVLSLRNDGATAADVRLVDPATGAVYAEAEGIGPGATRRLRLELGGGAYAFRCADDAGGDPVTGPVTRISGPPGGRPAILPVTGDDLYGPARAYGEYVSAGLGRPAYSDPLDEQQFIVSTINKIQRSAEWRSTAIFIAYDDSDGWYDHVAPKILNGSSEAAVDDPALCGRALVAGGHQDRCRRHRRHLIRRAGRRPGRKVRLPASTRRPSRPRPGDRRGGLRLTSGRARHGWWCYQGMSRSSRP